MNQRNYIASEQLVFSKWSRKNYAVFASLGKQVKIGVLKAYICQKALLKGLVDIITISKNTEDTEENESEVNIADQSNLQLSFFVILVLSVFNLNSVISSQENFCLKKLYRVFKVCFLQIVESRLFLCPKS
jgi:hypothetical protein